MNDVLARLGWISLETVWLPVAAWTLFAGLSWAALARAKRLHPLTGYRLRQALLIALPATVAGAALIPSGMGWRPAGASWVGLEPAALVEGDVGLAGRSTTEGLGRVEGPAPGASADPAAPFDPAVEALLPVDVRGGPAAKRAIAPTLLGPAPPSGRVDALLAVLGLITLFCGAVAVARLLGVGREIRLVRRISEAAEPVDTPGTDSVLRGLTDRMGVRRPVRLLGAPDDAVPMTFGVLHPTIVLPSRMLGDPESMRIALAHELTHVRRRDYLWGIVERTVVALFGLHPLVAALGRGIDEWREVSCDAEVVSSTLVSPRAYATLLVALGTRPPDVWAPTMAARDSSRLERRLNTMTRFLHVPVSGGLRKRSTATAVAAAAMIATLGACGIVSGEAEIEPTPDVIGALGLTTQFGYLDEETRKTTLKYLQAQVAYLEGEIDRGRMERQQLYDDVEKNARLIETGRQRNLLLAKMWNERLEMLEALKMEMAVASMLDD